MRKTTDEGYIHSWQSIRVKTPTKDLFLEKYHKYISKNGKKRPMMDDFMWYLLTK